MMTLIGLIRLIYVETNNSNNLINDNNAFNWYPKRHLESCTSGTRQYKMVCTGTSQYVPYLIQGRTRNLKMVHTSTYQHRKFLWQYKLVCTGMYCLAPAQYKVVQGGTRWYKMVQGGTNNSIWRYMEVEGSTRIVKIVQAGMYWHVLILTIQSVYADLLLDSLLQFCLADSAVLETTASNHTNASSSMFQSTAASPAANLVTSPALIGRGRRQRRLFGGRGRFRRRGRRRCMDGSGSFGRGLTALALASSEGTGMGPLVGRARKQSG
jgi:hypothetical protein